MGRMRAVSALFPAVTASLWLSAAGAAEDERQQLLELLEEQTEIATKTRLNADYVPGMVTVLHGDELGTLGARTVWEALGQVSGIEPIIDRLGQRQLVFRGTGDIFFSGNVKVMLNGVPVNSAQKGMADPVLNMPVEQVDRIEVIRGPGSAIHGEYAYAGVVDVITRREGQAAFLGGSSHDGARAGAVLSSDDGAGGFNVDLNVAGWRRAGTGIDVGRDILHATPDPDDDALSNAPGSPNDRMEAFTGVARVTRGGFTLLGQWSEESIGDHYGINGILPPGDRFAIRQRIRSLEARHEMEVTAGLTARFRLGRTSIEEHKDDQYLHPLFAGFNLAYEERRDNIGAELLWERGAHTWLTAAEYSDIRVQQADSWPWPYSVAEDTKRRIRAFTIQDEYRASDTLTITAGLRHDDYSDAGNSTSPRLAAVWRLSDTHIVKAQYAQAFRPPTFYETRDNVDPATIDTYEAGYIYNGPRKELRSTLFHSRLDNLVAFRGQGFANAETARITGVELEAAVDINPRLELGGNLSFLDSEDDATGEEIPGSATWLANLTATYRRPHWLTWGARLRMVDGYHREANDPRSETDSYETLDLTATTRGLAGTDWILRAGVKNLFDSDGIYPAPMMAGPTSEHLVAYEDDFPRPGRTWWVQLSLRR